MFNFYMYIGIYIFVVYICIWICVSIKKDVLVVFGYCLMVGEYGMLSGVEVLGLIFGIE